MNGNYILTDAEREKIAIKVAMLTKSDPTKLDKWLPRFHYLSIDRDSKPLLYGYNVVMYCERKAWVAKPGLLIRLLEIWRTEADIAALIEQVKQVQPPQYHPDNRPWDTCLVHLDIPWISRTITRQAIEAFDASLKKPDQGLPAARVLVVNGPPQSGKTYTCEFIRYIRAMYTKGQFELAMLDYKKVSQVDFGPKQFIGLLLDQVNPEWPNQLVLPELENQQPARWVRELCGILREQVFYAGTTWCFVLDGFDSPRVPPQIVQCIQYLACLTAGYENFDPDRDVMRLVLLGFRESIPNYGKRVRIESLKEPELADIRHYFQCYANYREVELPSQALDDMAALVLDDQQELEDPDDISPAPANVCGRMYNIARKAALIARTTIIKELAS